MKQTLVKISQAALIGSMITLAACASGQDIQEVSVAGGNPLRVASNVCVEVTDQLGSQTPAGGLVSKQCIQGMVVMSRVQYDKLLSERADALAAVSRANKAIIETQSKQEADKLKEEIVFILAKRCRENATCYAEAKPYIASAMGVK